MSSRLLDYLPEPPASADVVLDRFLAWVHDQGLEPYPAQEEAFLELMAGRHVFLGTPTGSGKSLVAALLHFKAMCEHARSFYTSPTKALASEKFFWLCEQLGPENVGMLTGDASINSAAPVICCTTEVLANMALRRGEATEAPYVVLDEFHYYADAARGVAWQIPLITLPQTQFLIMSATMGDTSDLAQRLEARSGRPSALVLSEERPVPLDFEYRETALQETVEALLEQGKAPIYVVFFTQRECAEQAQALTSAKICTKDERREVARALGDFRFDTAYGKDMRRFLGFGIGVHHAGLLPKYRLLVEQLSQQGLLKVICGTDTLGVGVNIPIRTVLFSGLAKFDGTRVSLLSAREFRQIAGRAGRKGFDDRGSVVCQAPEHVIRRKRAQQGGRRTRKAPQPPRRAPVPWNEDNFQKLVHRPAEPLQSRFDVNHGMMVQVLQRDPDGDAATGYRAIADVIHRSHERPARQARLLRRAALVFRSLRRAGIVTVERESDSGRALVRISEELQRDFSLHHTLSLYLVDAIHALDEADPEYALDVVSLVEAILEDPRPILYAQEDVLKRDLIALLKAERVPYEERMKQLEDVHYPQPNADFIYATFDYFAEHHPWVRHQSIRPKSIARELYETYSSFEDYVRRYGLARIEGRLLRYLGDVYKTLLQNVPEFARTPELHDVIAFLRVTVQGVDSSLFEEWESLVSPGAPAAPQRDGPAAALAIDLVRDERARTARIRAEVHRLVQLLAGRRYEEAAASLNPDSGWSAADLEHALTPFLADCGDLRFDHRARLSEHTVLSAAGPARWEVSQALLDAFGNADWALYAEVDLSAHPNPSQGLLRLQRICP